MPKPPIDAASPLELVQRHETALRDLTLRLHVLEHHHECVLSLLRDTIVACQEASPYARIDLLRLPLAALDALLHNSDEK